MLIKDYSWGYLPLKKFEKKIEKKLDVDVLVLSADLMWYKN